MHLGQVLLAVQVRELIGCVFMTFRGAPVSNITHSLDGAYLGPFM